jgi:hypothetical protein
MNKTLAILLSTTAAASCLGLGAHAQTTDAGAGATTTTTTTVTTDTVETKVIPPPPGLTQSENKDLKTQSKAQYKARKNIAEANHDLNKADCKVSSDGAVQRACKGDARAQEKKEKADAKLIHAEEKADIDAKTH